MAKQASRSNTARAQQNAPAANTATIPQELNLPTLPVSTMVVSETLPSGQAFPTLPSVVENTVNETTNETEVSPPAKKQRKRGADRNSYPEVDMVTFCVEFQQSNSYEEAANRLKMTPDAVMNRAQYYRRRHLDVHGQPKKDVSGQLIPAIALKTFRRGPTRSKLDVGAITGLNTRLADILKQAGMAAATGTVPTTAAVTTPATTPTQTV